MCPLLLDPLKYTPDTLDLNKDEEARDYWIDCFLQVAKKFAVKAANSGADDPTASERAQQLVTECKLDDFVFTLSLLFFSIRRYLSDYNEVVGTFKQDTERYATRPATINLSPVLKSNANVFHLHIDRHNSDRNI